MPTRKGTVSIRDVAGAAGVSLTTVSHALNGNGRVNDATSARVLRVAQELGYRANPSARHVRRGRTGIIAIAISLPPDVPYGVTDLEFLVVALGAAAETALEHHRFPTLLPPLSDLALLDSLPADGAVVMDPVPHDPVLARMHDHGLATVTVGRDRGDENGQDWMVDSDFDRITAAMLDHLALGGARRILLLTTAGGQSYMDDQRDAYLRWVRAHGFPEAVYESQLPFDEQDFKRRLSEMLGGPESPDAIYVVPERMTPLVFEALDDAGLSVPDDVAVAVASENMAARSARVPVTAVDLDPAAVGRAAVELLLARLDGAERSGPRLVPARIRVRASTARGRVASADAITVEG